MGLFSGFSIISGVEIIFFLAKFLYKGVLHCKEKYGFKDNDKSKIENEDVKDDNNDDTLIWKAHTTGNYSLLELGFRIHWPEMAYYSHLGIYNHVFMLRAFPNIA